MTMLTVSSGSIVNSAGGAASTLFSCVSGTTSTSSATSNPALACWMRFSSSAAAGTALPAMTASRMRCSSSTLCCNSSSIMSVGLTRPSSIEISRVSSSWLRLPMEVMPAMRAPPFNVCRWRLSSAIGWRNSLFLLHSISALSADSSSSADSSVKIAAISASYSASSVPAATSGSGVTSGSARTSGPAGTSASGPS